MTAPTHLDDFSYFLIQKKSPGKAPGPKNPLNQLKINGYGINAHHPAPDYP